MQSGGKNPACISKNRQSVDESAPESGVDRGRLRYVHHVLGNLDADENQLPQKG